jgi:hypothetical protein
MFEVPTGRTAVRYFWIFLVPIALIHIGCCLFLCLRFPQKTSIIFGFWFLSLAIVLLLGGFSRFIGLIQLLIPAFCLFEIGSALMRWAFEEYSESFALPFGIGMLTLTFFSSYLAVLHLFRKEVLFILIIVAMAMLWRKKELILFQKIRILKTELVTHWNITTLIAVETFFLISVYCFIDSTAPENSSDSVRFYWPYIKLLRNHFGIFSNPYQWSYVIPQAGLAYAGSIYILAGGVAVRWAMFLSLLTIIALIVRGKVDHNFGIRLSLAVLLASTPIVLRLSSTLMQDIFAALVVLTLAVVCIEIEDPRLRRFFVIGIISGLAWSSKYSAMIYAVPLVLWAVYRVFKRRGILQAVKLFSITTISFLVGAAPWMWHSYQATNNPFFPAFSSFFRSDIWPQGLLLGNLEGFKLPDGLRGWILWPVELTYDTHLYVEGFDGYLGLILPFLLVLLLSGIFKLDFSKRVFLVIGIIGTYVLWTKTVYIRYWLPGLCFLTIAAAQATTALFQNHPKWRLTFCIFCTITCLVQIPIEMLVSFSDPVGFAIDVYSNRISNEQYLERVYPGYQKFQKHFPATKNHFPRIWFSDFQGVGHLNVEPMEAAIWKLKQQGLHHPREMIKYLCSKNCKYWIVDEGGGESEWFQLLGLSPFLWHATSKVESKRNSAMYLMPSEKEALNLFDRRAKPGTDLLINGRFESQDQTARRHWSLRGVQRTSNSLITLNPNTGILQTIPLPTSLKRILVTVKAKKSESSEVAKIQVSLVWKKPDFDNLSQEKKVFTLSETWQTLDMKINIPVHAAWSELYVSHSEGKDAILIDEVHMYSE